MRTFTLLPDRHGNKLDGVEVNLVNLLEISNWYTSQITLSDSVISIEMANKLVSWYGLNLDKTTREIQYIMKSCQ